MPADAPDIANSLAKLVMSDKSEDKLIIALDFGTTYSGIAYCFTNQRDCIPISIKNWPGAESPDAPKIPTLIKYSKNNPNEFEWGASLNSSNDGIVGIKLLLDPGQKRPTYLGSSKSPKTIETELDELPKTAIEVTADFIGAMYQHAVSEIAKRFSRNYVDLCRKEYVLSVPAVWSDAAKDATLRAAKMAGLDPVQLIKEPEAAALWTAKKMDRRLHRNDTFIVCDAGGGTVDLISYQVEAALPRLQVKEVVPGTGVMAGSLSLNKRFADNVRDVVGDDWPALKNSKAFFLANKQFDREIKKSFRGEEDEEYYVNFPTAKLEDKPDNGLEASTWRMTGDDVAEIFEPIILAILKLIKDQVQKVKRKQGDSDLKGIYLVGGFGSNQYLIERVREALPDVEVLQPPDAWAAIAKGAALSRVPREAIVTTTSATRHYGVAALGIHDPVRDNGRPNFVGRDGMIRSELMTWYINIGDDLLRDQKTKFPFSRPIDYEYDDYDLIFHVTLYECERKTAPVHHLRDGCLKENCTTICDLSDIPKSKLERKIDQRGFPYWDVHYDLVVTLESAVMKFGLEIDGESFGSVEAKYN